MANKEAVKIKAPDIAEDLIKLKVDPVTQHVNLDQSPLYRCLQQFLDFVRGLHSQAVANMRLELEGHIDDMKKEIAVSLQESILELEQGFKAKLEASEELSAKTTAALEELQKTVKSNAAAVASNAAAVATNAAAVASTAAAAANNAKGIAANRSTIVAAVAAQPQPQQHRHERHTVSDVRPVVVSHEREAHERHTVSTVPQPVLPRPLASKQAIATVGEEDEEDEESHRGSPTLPAAAVAPLPASAGGIPPSPSAGGRTPGGGGGFGGGLPPGVDPEMLTSLVQQFATGAISSKALSKKDIAHLATKDEFNDFKESVRDHQTKHEGVIQATRHDVQRVDKKIDEVEAELADRLDSADELAKKAMRKGETLEVRANRAESDAAALAQRARTLEEDLLRLMQEKAEVTVLAEVQRDVADVRGIAERAILSASLAPRVERLEVDARAALQSVDECGKRLETGDGYARDLSLRLEQQGRHLEEADQKLEGSVRARCEALSSKSRAIDRLVSDVQGKVLELSTVVRGLARKGQVQELQEAVSAMTHDLREKDSSVLFGARCLSCNREFDDIQKTAGIVDLNGDKQKAKLFAEVQRALHAPAADQTKQVKMIAVKVGRSTHVVGRGGGGTFEGRDATTFACGIEDVQLVPCIRRPPGEGSRPATTDAAKTPRRRLVKGDDAPAFVPSASQREGPLDFKKPLSHLVGRSERESANHGDSVSTAAPKTEGELSHLTLTQPLPSIRSQQGTARAGFTASAC